jgi:TonB family protein
MRFGLWFPVWIILGAATAHAQDAKPCTPEPGATEEPILDPITKTHRSALPPLEMLQKVWERNPRPGIEMNVHIQPDGTVEDIDVVKSTGLREMDSLLVSHVKRLWRWNPPLSRATCEPVATQTTIKMEFFMRR